MSWLIAICRPETGAVRCKHLITDNDISILIQTKLKLGICNNDALAQCVVCTLLIQCDSVITKLLCILLAFSRKILLQMNNALLIRNILIMITDLSLCRWCINWLRQLIRPFKPSGSSIPHTFPVFW